MSETNKRQILIACALSLCCPGLGHVHLGRLKRGLVFFLTSMIVVPLAALLAAVVASSGALGMLLAAYGGLVMLWLAATVDAGRIASQMSETESRESQPAWIYALFLGAGMCTPLASALHVRSNVFEAFYLPANSMAPTLRNGDRILVNKTLWRKHTLDRFDLVVFRPPGRRNQNYIKRLVGLPGDEIVINDGEVNINGKPLNGPGAISASPAEKSSKDPAAQKDAAGSSPDQPRSQLIPQGMCFVLGDNRGNSIDSRSFGLVPLGDIVGVAEFIYLPADSWGRFGRVR